ncbi:RNA-directed DNA polymerase [Tanacetum coccineum]
MQSVARLRILPPSWKKVAISCRVIHTTCKSSFELYMDGIDSPSGFWFLFQRGGGGVLVTRKGLTSLSRLKSCIGNLLRSLIGDNAKQWDLILPQAEFAYNRSINRTTGKSPFEVVYGRNPITPLDLVPVPEVGRFSKEGANPVEQYKVASGDLVWIHLRKERFPAGHFGKLKPRGDGPFRVLKKINDNEYKIELPDHYNVSATFNVADLSPYKGDSVDEPDSWSSLFKKGRDDARCGSTSELFGTYLVLKKFGVERYDPVNEQFDPNRHNAVFQVPDSSKPPNTVVPGYTLHERIIRPAEVGVVVGVAADCNETD